MRQLFSFFLTAAAALSAAACGGNTAVAAVAPARSGEFRVLIPARPATLNPDLGLNETAFVVGSSLFNRLVSLNEGGRLLPDLARSWTISADGLTYTFLLQPGVRWHDGAPFSSQDVKWTLETIKERGHARDSLAPLANVETPDALTVVLRLHHPWAPFVSDLAGPALAILPRHHYEGQDWRTAPANERPVGTGPFRFSGWRDRDTLVLEANPTYFRSGPFIRQLVFEAVPPEAILGRLLDGTADYSITRPTLFLGDAPPAPLVVRTLPSSARFYLAMNLRRAPLDDTRIRRALAAAVKRDTLIESALGGIGAPAVGWYTPDVEWAYNAAARVPDFDLEEATRLLQGAKYGARAGGRRLSFVVAALPGIREMAELLAAQFAAVGVAVDVVGLPVDEWVKRVVGARDYDLSLISGNQGPDPDALRRRFLASSAEGAYIGYDAPRFRAAVEEGARAVDIAARAAAYHRAQEILAADVPFIPLVESVKVLVFNKRVSGLPQLEARGLVGGFDFSLVKVAPPAATVSR